MDAIELTTGLTTPAGDKVTRKPRKKDLKNLTRRNGIWYFQKVVNGKKEFNGQRTPFSLNTADLVLAKARRDAVLKGGRGADLDRALGREGRGAATLGEIFACYRKAPTVRANATTREHNLSDLARAVRLVRGPGFDVEAMSSADLTKAFVKQWQALRLGAATVECAGDLAALEAAKRTMNSLLTHMQSLFSREARDDYGALYLPPNVAEFATALPVAARKQEAPRQLSDEAVTELWAAAEDLAKTDFAAWTVFQLMTYGGLRNKECAHAQTGWLERVKLGYRLEMKPTADFLPKGNSRAVILPADVVEPILAAVTAANADRARAELPADPHLVVAKNKTDRDEACYRRINLWLKARGVGEDAGKVAYRLRKFFLNKVSEQQGIMLAQAAAGHSSMQTTQDHYTGRPQMQQPVRL